MLKQKELIRLLKHPALRPREEGCFGSFYSNGREDRPSTHYLRSSGTTPSITARYEAFEDPETGETLYRFV